MPSVRNKTRKTGNRGHRLSGMTNTTPEIRERQREAQRVQTVTRRFVDPTPAVRYPSKPATEKQLAYLRDFAKRLGQPVPDVSTRLEASVEIGRLKALRSRERGAIPPPRTKAGARKKGRRRKRRTPA